jgi:hypothetical protein
MITALLTFPLLALAAGVSNVFSPGTVISAGQVNQNFAQLADRVTKLEDAARRKTVTTTVLENERGPQNGASNSFKSRPFNTSGGTLLVFVSGSAFTGTASALPLEVDVRFDDGATIARLTVSTNEGLSHKGFPTRVVKVDAPAGSHTLTFVAGANTTIDNFDFFSATVVELAQ